MLSSLRKKAARPEDHPRPCELTLPYAPGGRTRLGEEERRQWAAAGAHACRAPVQARRALNPARRVGCRHKTWRPRKVAIKSVAHHRELRTGMVRDFVPMTGDPGCPHLHGIRRESNHVGLVTRCEPS